MGETAKFPTQVSDGAGPPFLAPPPLKKFVIKQFQLALILAWAMADFSFAVFIHFRQLRGPSFGVQFNLLMTENKIHINYDEREVPSSLTKKVF